MMYTRLMGFLDLFRKRPDDRVVVFAGERSEAELVMRMLEEEGFHPFEWADMPSPAYVGPIGTARIVVPAEEAEGAGEFLAALREGPLEGD